MPADSVTADLTGAVLGANLHENLNVRLEYNGTLYDEWVADVARSAVHDTWDPVEGRLLMRDGDNVRRLRSRLIGLHDLAGGFSVLLEEWGLELDAVIAEVSGYIERKG